MVGLQSIVEREEDPVRAMIDGVLVLSETRSRDVREPERTHFKAGMPSAMSIPGVGSAARSGPGHTGSPAAAAKRASITFSRLPSRAHPAARRLRRL